MKRVMVFIDSNNFESAVNSLFGGLTKLDYPKLANDLADTQNGELIRLYFYTAQGDPKKEPAKFQATQNFIDRLNKREDNCIVRVGRLMYLGLDSSGKNIISEKGTDVNIATDMVALACNNAYDVAILVSADTDYVPVLEQVRSIGKQVVLCLVDQQKGGYLKEFSDSNIVLSKAFISKAKR